jgi:hypothetical protein
VLKQVGATHGFQHIHSCTCLCNRHPWHAYCFMLVSDGQWGGRASGIVHCFNFTLPYPVLHGTTDTESQSHGPTTPFSKPTRQGCVTAIDRDVDRQVGIT